MKKLLSVGLSVLLASVSGLAMAAGDATAGEAKTTVCAACHNVDGNATVAINPRLAGQHESYLAKQIHDFTSGTRVDAVMMSMVGTLSDQDIQDVAAYYSAQQPAVAIATEENLGLGESIYRGGIASAGIAACIACHGPTGTGNPTAGYPVLAGQNAAYTAKTLGDFRNSTRANDENGVMRMLVKRMTDAEIAAVSNYIQGLY